MATRTVSNAGGNYNSTGTWVEGVVPTSADDVVFTATSGNLTINVASAAKTVNFTNYTNTVSGTSTWTISGNVTLAAGFTFGGTWTMAINATSSLTSNGKTFSARFTIASAITATFVDDWTFNGTLTTFSTNCVLNRTGISAGNLYLNGAVTTGALTGTSKLVINGVTHTASGTVGNAIEVNATSGTYTLSGTLTITGSYTYISGNTNMGTSTVVFGNGCTCTPYGTNTGSVTSSTGMNFYDLRLSPPSTLGSTCTIGSDITAVNSLTNNNGNSNMVISGSYNIYCRGNLSVQATGSITVAISGSPTIILAGSGTVTMVASIALPVVINTSGSYTITTMIMINNSLTYTAGTVTATSLSFPLNSTTFTLNTPGITWGTITNSSPGLTLTLNATLLATTFIISNVTNPGTNILTLAGTAGFTVSTLSIAQHNASSISFTPGLSYIVTTAITTAILTKSQSGNMTFKSVTPGTRATLTLQQPGTCDLIYIDATDMDSSAGRTIRTYKGVLSNCLNWNTFSTTDLPTIAFSGIT